MSWQQPQGNYPQQQQQGGGNWQQQQQQQGGYYPQQGGYYPQQGGYQQQGDYYPQQQGGYYPQQGGYYPPQQGGYPQQGGFYPQQGGGGGGFNTQASSYVPQQQRQVAPQEKKPAAAPVKSTYSDANKLSLGGGAGGANSAIPPMPTPKKGGLLVLGKKRQEEEAAKAAAAEAEVAKQQQDKEATSPSSPKSEEPTKKTPAAEGATSPKVASPTDTTGGSSTDLKNRSKMTPEELREAVRQEIAKQREQSKKQYVRDPRPHFSVVFCGHVDAGKSTISGHLLMEKGLVDQREMDKLRQAAQTHHREGWEYAYVMDVSEEERAKGITRETGAAYFETEKRRITVLDAPGHKAFVPSMIGGATQADVCVLVISSRTGEFETGFEKGGQTREHAMLVRTCGVKQMICVVNKMDDMEWSKERFDEIVTKLKPFLRQNGYDEKLKNLIFIPVAGLTGENLIKSTEESVCPWYRGQTMMEVIDNLVIPESKSENDVLCIPVVGAYKDDGKTFIYGKVESGSIAVGEKLQILPAKQEALVEGISIESTEFEKCYPGDNVHIRVRGIEESDIHAGYVATSVPTSMRAVEFIQARVVILDVKNILCAGSHFMIHAHAAQEEASLHKLLAKLDKKTGEVIEKNPACAKAGDVVMVRLELDRPIVCETHKTFDKMGRFMLRDDGKTIAIGLVSRLYESTHDSLAEGK